ncbi:LOW QUALITY PROTEIN: pleckstrin homology domain-containing family G member 3 [Solea solea]|uniref:LOW QUALITY PROTEIN: pleckstrin homology domain-containing family G member 3 n=1 Tax=Solea solea TaxID=90069 RepID=UPI00272B2241|nr:LOW QUALITY PROTEIN: pleckstrin homology domain-containing family G member 3 [Solea solea]
MRRQWCESSGSVQAEVCLSECACHGDSVNFTRTPGDMETWTQDNSRHRHRTPGDMDTECSRLSNASISSNEHAPSATPSDSSDRRPLSLISTLSSGSGSSCDDGPAPPPSSSNTPNPEGDEEAGQCPQSDRKGQGLILNNNNNNKVLTTTRASSRRQQSGNMVPNCQLTYLDRVVMEIIETERMYVKDLRMIVEDYLSHLIDCSDVSIRPEQVCSLFGNIEDIYEFNSELLQALDLCDKDAVAVARCFVVKSEYFEIYTQYCTNYPQSVAALTECMRNKSLVQFFRERQALLKRSLPLGSYLLKPVQRILKYHLLLQEIAKHFDPEEEGYEVVEEAIYTMTGVAWYINEMKRKHEHAVRLQEVQSLLLNWKGPDLTTYGELVLEGTFKVHRAKNERTLFLFDRMLLITKRRGEHYVYKTHITCSTLMLIESAKDSLSFSVTHYKHPKQPHTVQAKTVEEKKLWAHHIKRIILENHHAIIPQKVRNQKPFLDQCRPIETSVGQEKLVLKMAILEMDSIHPPRYRCSPERLKKVSARASPGRRQSELNTATLKPDTTDILQATASSSTLDSSQNQSEAEEDGLSPQRSHQVDKVLLEDDQVEDFSSSVLAAISCWSLRVQVFLSNSVTSSVDKLPQETTSESEPAANPEAESLSDVDSALILASPRRSEELRPEGEAVLTEEPDSDSKTLSSGDSSDDEEDDKDAAKKEDEATSILPSSVLDKASAIAQHFSNSIKRGSVAQDDAHSLCCASPRLPSRTGSSRSLSLSAEPVDRMLRLNSVCSDLVEAFSATDSTLLSPRGDNLFDGDRGIQQRRDSILSKQDQLLIGKIRSYYENAESQDANFRLQRRESLTYIPTGMVRSSVSRFNSIPKDKPALTNLFTTTTSSSSDPSSVESPLTVPTDQFDHMVFTDPLRSFKSDQRSMGPEDSAEGLKFTSQSLEDTPLEDEEFRPSSEMIKIWQVMERDITISPNVDRACEARRNFTKIPNKNQDQEASDLNTDSLESKNPSSLTVLKVPLPVEAQLKVEAEEEMSQVDDVDKTKNKVLHLARQYSQRLKPTQPVVRQRIQGVLISKKTLPCVVEETEVSEKPNLTLKLVSQHKSSFTPLSPIDQSQPSTPLLGVVSSGQASTCSPISPPPPTESFTWPDVRELRSKYLEQKGPVGRSHSIPEQMFGDLRRHSSCSSGHFLCKGTSMEVPPHEPCSSQDTSSKPLLRAKSLDPQLSRVRVTELQKLQEQVVDSSHQDYFIAAETPLPDDPQHKMVIIEKLPAPESDPSQTALKTKQEEVENDDSYVQIRSPTSREKISIMAVADRCRAYQDSDEYKLREEAKARSESVRPRELDQTEVSANNQNNEEFVRTTCEQKTDSAQQSVVKNLREKFQNLS